MSSIPFNALKLLSPTTQAPTGNTAVTSAAVPDISSPAHFPGLGPSRSVQPAPKAPKLTFPGQKPIKAAPEKGPMVTIARKIQPVRNRAVMVEIQVRETADDDEPVQAHARYALRTLKARLGYFNEKYGGHSNTTDAPATANADIVDILPWTMDAAAIKCVLRWIKRDDDPDTPPEGFGAQILTRVVPLEPRLTCLCMRNPDTPFDQLHHAKLYHAASLLRLIGSPAKQTRLEEELTTECKTKYVDEQGVNTYNEFVNQVMDICWDQMNDQWVNDEFLPKLLSKIVDHLEGIDGNKIPAPINNALSGANQTSFIASVAEVPTLNTDYETACNDYVSQLPQKMQEYEEKQRSQRESEEKRARWEQRQNQQGNNSSTNGNGRNQGPGSQSQQSDSKINTVTQEDGQKIYGKRGMGGS